MAMDSPDWQNIITLVSGGGVTDAPDWQTVVTGPGGTPPVGGGGVQGPGGIWANMGVLGLSVDPYAVTGTARPNSGQLQLSAFIALATSTVFSVNIGIQATGTLTANQNFAVIYKFGGGPFGYNLLAQSATGVADTAFASTGLVQVVLSTNPTITAGDTYAMGFLMNGTTPTLYAAVPSNWANDQPFEGTFVKDGQTTSTFTSPPAGFNNLGFVARGYYMTVD